MYINNDIGILFAVVSLLLYQTSSYKEDSGIDLQKSKFDNNASSKVSSCHNDTLGEQMYRMVAQKKVDTVEICENAISQIKFTTLFFRTMPGFYGNKDTVFIVNDSDDVVFIENKIPEVFSDTLYSKIKASTIIAVCLQNTPFRTFKKIESVCELGSCIAVVYSIGSKYKQNNIWPEPAFTYHIIKIKKTIKRVVFRSKSS